jgi:uncharacterized protein YkwD
MAITLFSKAFGKTSSVEKVAEEECDVSTLPLQSPASPKRKSKGKDSSDGLRELRARNDFELSNSEHGLRTKRKPKSKTSDDPSKSSFTKFDRNNDLSSSSHGLSEKKKRNKDLSMSCHGLSTKKDRNKDLSSSCHGLSARKKRNGDLSSRNRDLSSRNRDLSSSCHVPSKSSFKKFDLSESDHSSTDRRTSKRRPKKASYSAGGEGNEDVQTQDDDTVDVSSSKNLILVNRERTKAGLDVLTKNPTLEEMASFFARKMAKSYGTEEIKTSFTGNMMRGRSVRAIHTAFMNSDRERCNILNCDFNGFGMGSEKGEDGHLYICQLFDGEHKFLRCLDATAPSYAYCIPE